VTRLRTFSHVRRGLALAAGTGVLAVVASGCGGSVKADNGNSQDKAAAISFNQHCSGCHTLKPANAYGSKPQGQKEPGERTNGPNFNQRLVKKDDALYAIRNGGFSGAIMPANIVTGPEAERLAAYLDKYSGRERSKSK
jgi:mono/diheme cytochrome c family protein